MRRYNKKRSNLTHSAFCYTLLFMLTEPLTPEQIALINKPLKTKIFLEGPYGSGKTVAGVERLLYLMAKGVRGDSILVIVPQRTLAAPYYQALGTPGVTAGGRVSVLTIGGLAQHMVELFWPLASEVAGFAHPDEQPVFLTLETAQYYMSRLVKPLMAKGYFESLVIDRNRLYSQILDNLNKAAVTGFPYTEIGRRLKAAWIGESSQAHIYDDAQSCATLFRRYCLQNNLLDFSLQIDVFIQHLWREPLVQSYLKETYRNLIVDNIEEDTPIAHDLLRTWLPDFDSVLLIYDRDAGYRSFLGADAQTAYSLKDLCDEQVVFNTSFVMGSGLQVLGVSLAKAFNRPQPTSSPTTSPGGPDYPTLVFEYHRYYPEMLDWVASQAAALVDEAGVSPGQIVILAPYLSDALRFSLVERLEQAGIPARSHRPSRALREEPSAVCMLTLAALAHPDWGIRPTRFDAAYAFVQAIEGMDLVRAQLLADIVYRTRSKTVTLSSFDKIKPDMQERITYLLGERYERLRAWIEAYSQEKPAVIDHFFSRLFGEVLSQSGYRFHRNYGAGETAANLVDSARGFRWSVESCPPEDGNPIGKEYLEMVQEGVIAAQYIRSWQVDARDAVLLAPAYTFLMSNRPVEVQFWLDIASTGWFERLYQPLTHPYVLSRHWPEEAAWTDVEESEADLDSLYRLTLGLVRRCRRQIYLGLSELSEQGYEHQGPLLKAIQRILRSQAV
jgi:hypothetical protein